MKKDKNQAKELTKKPIETLVEIDTNGKKESQLVAFRADFESAKRIEALVKLMNKPKTEIIKEAIRNSFDGLLIKDTLKRIFPVIKKEFQNAKIIHGGFGSHKEREDESEVPINLSIDEGTIFIELPNIKKKSKDKHIMCGLDILVLELKVEGLKTIRMKIHKPIVAVDINKVEATLFKDLQLIALNNNLELRSSRIDKNNMEFEFRLERVLDLHKEWINRFEKDMKIVHESLKQVENLKYFKGRKDKKVI
jgi:hypothetical protein